MCHLLSINTEGDAGPPTSIAKKKYVQEGYIPSFRGLGGNAIHFGSALFRHTGSNPEADHTDCDFQ